MVAIPDIVRHPSHMLSRRPSYSDMVQTEHRRHVRNQALGLIAIGLGVATFIWLYPELQRYIKIKRM